ncbi:phosphotransferase family protein [Actinomadura chibensis]|uniref:Aminoglycoside phosphotransferase family protein n=1 Tax=Actinomadura chibensis TaxID=392828 RepID=A0A5D0NY87_9ACTN|nr:aminoglycoside phosphotransferase family protein [Actinomadura chibensis]TYB49272.1 aminoglycoside phosphotransferase family protein [Actinomadura chibensis]
MSRSVALPDGWEPAVRAAVAEVRPDLAGRPLRPLGAGFESVALLLGVGAEAFVLRFPRNEDGAEGIACETRLLPDLAEWLDLPIPRFAFTAPNPLGPGTFCCYPVVPGESLPEEEWRARGLLDEPGPVRQMADVIEAIHSFPVERARLLGVPEVDLRSEFAGDLELVRADVAPLLPAAQAGALLSAYEDYLAEDANFDVPPTLTHADISLDHFLVTGTRVTGLIDFGDVCVGDPDYDLCFLWPETNREFVQRLQDHRGRPLDARLEAKLRFWSLADPATDVLHGLENDLPDVRDEGLRLLSTLLT